MNLVMTQYLEINLIAVFMLLIIFISILKSDHELIKNEEKILAKMLLTNIVVLLADCSIYLMRGHASLIYITHIICIVYFLMHSYFGYLWLRYSLESLYPGGKLKKIIKILILAPLIISSFIIIFTPWTKWVYSLSMENRYIRGSFLLSITFLAFSYWVASLILTLKELLQENRIRKKSLYNALLIFPIPTIIGNILQLKFYGLSVVWVCSALSLLILFINLQNHHISRDTLTGLFNRRHANKLILTEINALNKSNYLLFAIMVDVDNFKYINDNFGHIIGDKALIDTATILKDTFREKDFISRFGGDEFFILGRINEESEIKLLINNINRTLEDYNNNKNLFNLSLSMGYKIYAKNDSLTIDLIISQADKEMYKIKSEKKKKYIKKA